MPWYLAADALEGRNVRNLYIETVWFGVLSGLAATFVPVFALRLGATTAALGWLTALPALVNIVWVLPAARLIEHQRRPMPAILVSGLLQRLGYLALVVVPLLGAALRVPALILLQTLVAFPAAVINTAVTALLPDLTTPDRRGQVVSVRWLVLSAAETLAALAGGWLLGLMAVPLNYQLVLGLGTVVSLLGLVYLRRIQPPPAPRPRPAPGPGARSWRAALAGLRAQRPFLRFAAASFVFYWGIYLPAALWSVLRVRELGATDAWIGLIAMIVSVSTIAGYLYWGKVSARKGDRWVLYVTTAGIALYAFLTGIVPAIEWMILTSILGGIAWSGCNLALFNFMLAVCPADHRPTYIALYTALVNVTAFLGPLLGAALAGWIGLRLAFVLSGAVRLAGLALFVWLLRK